MKARSFEERLGDVRRVVGAAARLVGERRELVPEIARTSGLSIEGVALALSEHLELSPSDAELAALVSGAAETDRVHVILSAGVFVGALRAIALAKAAAPVVTVHASRRDPTFARALVESLSDVGVTPSDELDGASEVHVYGRDETIARVAAAALPGVVVRGHGTGLGVAVVTRAADVVEAAQGIAADVVPFDQRGCLSPRAVLVEGDEDRADRFGHALHDALGALGARVPRGALSTEERHEAVRYRETLSFAGRVLAGPSHVVGVAAGPIVLAPPGRHVHVRPTVDDADVRESLAPLARYVVALGSAAPGRAGGWVGPWVRTSRLGRMQRPPLDGPVDGRTRSR